MGRTAIGVLVGALSSAGACSTSGADENATLGPATTGSAADVDDSTSSTTNLTTPTTGISASGGPPDTTTDEAGSSTTGAGSEATSLSGSSSSPEESTGPMCTDLPTEGSYTPCVQGFFCPGGGTCLEDPAGSFQVCTRGCLDVCNCWPTPAGDHTAVPACRDDILASMALTCVLDCSGGATCPTDAWCHPQFEVCVFDTPSEGTSTGDAATTTGP